ncbi:MAG: UDP-N-acetylmuramate--L-alanine ligase [Niabella sp.]
MSEVHKNINNIQSVYFIGIGGIGMSAIAKYFLSRGIKVSGYDRTETEITRQLQAAGASVHYSEEVTAIPKDVDYVVYTPAIPKEHKELVFYQANGYNVVKRSDILKLITESSFNICVAGTHGKTTTSTMIAHLLRHSGFGCNAFLGGTSANYGTNFWSSENNVCVIEADEYDRSFLKLSPDIAVITAVDADHLDIYENEENVKEAFRQFAAKVKPGGLLLKKLGLDNGLQATETVSYSIQNTGADVYATNIVLKDGGYRFDAKVKEKVIEGLQLNMGGLHNVENMVAAIAVAAGLGIDTEKIKAAVADFKGVKRRFEYIVKQKDLVFIDDYAHHPEELSALINGVKSLFPEKRCTLIFQPHLYSRTRDFADDFARVLDAADNVILLPVYPARELPIEGVDSNMVADRMRLGNKAVMTKEQLLSWVEQDFKEHNRTHGDILITAGAGDIDKLLAPVKEILLK